MGLLDFFGMGRLSESKVDKVAKLAANPFAQPDVRMREMQRLLDDETDVALRGVLKRFASNANGHIADEDEKKWLEDALVSKGQAALVPLRHYIKTENKLTYALRAFRRIAGGSEAITFFLEVLNHYGPDDHRSTDAKLQLIWQLAEDLKDPRVLPGLTTFLLDHSDDVRWAIIDVLEKAADDKLFSDSLQQQINGHMTTLITDNNTSPRILGRVAEVVEKRNWQLGPTAITIAKSIENNFFIDKKHFVRRRAT